MKVSTPIALICTVGGSHEPILTAIRQAQPDYVCFICSGRDLATGRSGSDMQIIGKGDLIKAHPADEKPTLPNIPIQAKLDETCFEVVLVSPDDLDSAFETIRAALSALAQRFPNSRFLADYTGGTKTMTAALVAAALEDDAVELQLVTGSRVDLVKVRSGMETAMPANVERIRLQRAMTSALVTWRNYGYAEAAQGLDRLKPPRDTALAGQLRRGHDLSRAFDAWDRFDHVTAYALLDAYRPKIGKALARYFDALMGLTRETPRQEPMRLLDLWRNAQRRAAQGRYDDAVARVYRLLEWSAQWLLRAHCELDTSDISPDQLPPGISISANRSGKLQVELVGAWDLVERLTEGPAQDFIREHRGLLLDRINIRNQSILAHGLTPITQSDWLKIGVWFEEKLLPVLIEEAVILKIEIALPPQLPQQSFWES